MLARRTISVICGVVRLAPLDCKRLNPVHAFVGVRFVTDRARDHETTTKGMYRQVEKNMEVLSTYVGTGILEYKNGDVYDGEFLDGKKHGHGTIRYANGETFDGTFEHGRVHKGDGFFRWPNGDEYVGAWVNGRIQGTGKLTNKLGQIATGEFRKGKIYNGKGSRVDKDGHTQAGVWTEGKFTTFAKINALNRAARIGGDKSESKKGSNGDTKVQAPKYGKAYEGELLNQLPHGQGTFNCNSFSYTGQWKQGQRCGQGRAEYDNGSSYEGQWLANCHHGQGTFTSKQYTYVGQWKEGQWCGQGRAVYTDGRIYDGQWLSGKLHGKGSLLRPSGEAYEGEWRNGKRHGWGVVTYPTGERLEGEFRENNIHHGEGALRLHKGTVQRGRWVDGVFDGEETSPTS